MRIALSLALVLVGAPAFAASADPATGEQIAKAECASCHAIGIDDESRDRKAPRFVDVAKMPSTTELSLKVFLRSSHKNMPNIILSREEIDSLASYILGLGGK
ncbi:MAG: cytochrome c [Methylocystis sp.]|uniref:c-type cytochrome n=1 Tax=Methylocystis sp. TaxID=1911079 RepID=UPI003D0C5FA4